MDNQNEQESKPVMPGIVAGEYIDEEDDEYFIRDKEGKVVQVTKEEHDEFIKNQKNGPSEKGI